MLTTTQETDNNGRRHPMTDLWLWFYFQTLLKDSAVQEVITKWYVCPHCEQYVGCEKEIILCFCTAAHQSLTPLLASAQSSAGNILVLTNGNWNLRPACSQWREHLQSHFLKTGETTWGLKKNDGDESTELVRILPVWLSKWALMVNTIIYHYVSQGTSSLPKHCVYMHVCEPD